jgi:hypothetical protein
MRRPINTVNGTYKDPNLAFSAQDALNVIPMMTEKSGTRTVSQYRQAPGLKPFCRIGTNSGGEVGFVAAGAGRGLRVVDGKLYAVAGRNLWQITSAGVSVNYGTIPGVGRVSMAHNQRGLGNELAIDNGQSRYVFNTQTQVLQKVTDESFPGSIKAVFIDGYIVFVEPQGRYWGHSDLSNALNYNIFDQYEAEGQPDRIVSAHESNRELLIFGQDTTEAYVNNPSGSGEGPFVRATNTVIKSGCAARDSVCDVGPYTVYLDQNRTVQVLNGYTPVPISTSVIDSVLQACTKQQIANAYAFAVESEGFQIYYLTVPGKFTFGYDFKNREWHRRSSTGLDWWAVTDVVQWNGSWYALDSRRGDILELRWYDYPFDVQEELVRECVTGTITADQNPIFVSELEFLFGCGGKEYTTVDFPDQPVGPSISGSAPDGTVGQAYTFTYTVTEGDNPIQRVKLMEGTILDGLTWNQYTHTLSGTPTEAGTMSLRFRVFDSAGLWAEVEDEIAVGLATIAIRQRNVAGQNYTDQLLGGSGLDWDGEWEQVADATDPNLTYIRSILDNFVMWGSTGAIWYSADAGAGWQPSSGDGAGGSGGMRGFVGFGQVGIIAGGVNEMIRTVDKGLTFANIAGSPPASLIAGNALNLVSTYDTGGDSDSSTDEGDTWTDGPNPGFVSVSGRCSGLFDGYRYYGGSKTGPVASLKRTLNGSSFEDVLLPTFASGTQITAFATTVLDGEPSFVIGTNTGEIAYYDPTDGDIKLSAQAMDVRCRDIAFSGASITFIGSQDGTGQIWTSTDGGRTLTKAREETGQTGEWTGVASQVTE